ncbi:hypothetical protein B296_00019070 [Ensete ventricosum]|uniref:Uncharacterized protein n=1 Tax=Ensete ventricosum TaxID=4639 RepID=A0A426XP19_ENSVE|nr:hypothetical protein B296_00019070 [Ensete ventricosum]
MARPPTGAVDCDQPIGVAVAPRYGCLQCDTHRDGRLQGAPARGGRKWPARKGLPPVARVAISKGSYRLHRGGDDGDNVVREITTHGDATRI